MTVVGPAVVDPILNAKEQTKEKFLKESCKKTADSNKDRLLQYTYVFAKEADPHGRARAAHIHSEGGLQESIGHTCQVHIIVSALLQGLKPGEIFEKQQDGVVIDVELLCGDLGPL